MASPVNGPTKNGGTPVPDAPVQVGGTDSNGVLRSLRTDTSGNIGTTAGTPTSKTFSAPTANTVGVTSAEAVAVNANRTGLVLVNTSANWISLAIGAAAVLYSGITLAPNGGVWEMGPATFTTGQVRAIASAATSVLAIQEMT